MNYHDPLLLRQLYRPDADAMRLRLPDLGESLHNAAVELGRDLTPDRCDQFAARLQTALDFTRHLRRALVEGGSP